MSAPTDGGVALGSGDGLAVGAVVAVRLGAGVGFVAPGVRRAT